MALTSEGRELLGASMWVLPCGAAGASSDRAIELDPDWPLLVPAADGPGCFWVTTSRPEPAETSATRTVQSGATTGSPKFWQRAEAYK